MISNLGRVCRILKPQSNCRSNYSQITLSKNKVIKSRYVHRLVADAFIPNTEGKPTVNHKDFDKTNNNASNLEWSSYVEQSTHNYENGRSLKYIKLYKDRKHIQEEFSKGNITRSELAKKYNVPLHRLQKICVSGTNSKKQKLSEFDVYDVIGSRSLGVPVELLAEKHKVSKTLIHAYYRNYVNAGIISSSTSKLKA